MAVIDRSDEIQGTRGRQVDIPTRETVRLLTLRGLEAAEAANLTAYLCGIAVGNGSWKLAEINRLLFLRDLSRRGQFGPADGEPGTRFRDRPSAAAHALRSAVGLAR
jgi:hypothetical protein